MAGWRPSNPRPPAPGAPPLPAWLSGAANTIGQGIGGMMGPMTAGGANPAGIPQQIGSGFTGAMDWIQNLGAPPNPAAGQSPFRAPEFERQPRVPETRDAGGAGGAGDNQMWGFPQMGGGQGNFQGMGDAIRAMNENRPPSFAQGMQDAMGQIGGQLNQNVSNMLNRDQLRLQEAALRDQSQRESERTRMMASMMGLEPERVRTGTERVQGENRSGSRSQPTYEWQFNRPEAPAQPQFPMGSMGPFQRPGGEIGAANNLVADVLRGAAPAAMNQGGGIGGFQFAGPGGVFGGGQLPTPPWAGGQGGSADAGVDTTAGQVWNPQLASEAAGRLGAGGPAQTPGMGANADPAVQRGLTQQFGDLMRGMSARTGTALGRAGSRAEAQHLLESQVGGTQLQNSLWRLMSQIYGSNLGTGADRNAQALQMLQAIS